MSDGRLKQFEFYVDCKVTYSVIVEAETQGDAAQLIEDGEGDWGHEVDSQMEDIRFKGETS
jgi:hypothetical protein